MSLLQAVAKFCREEGEEMKDYLPENVTIEVGGRTITGFTDGDVCVMHKDDHNPRSFEAVERIKTKEVEIHYDVIGAGPVGHPEEIFERICRQNNWEIIDATPHSVGDYWIFKVRMYSDSNDCYLPSYITIIEDN